MNLLKYQRPIIYLPDWYGVNAMLDTGAIFPVWTAGAESLIKAGGVIKQRNISFYGFGGKVVGDLYVLKYFALEDLIFSNMSILVHEMRQPYHMLLSATMFNNLIYEIDNKNHKFNVCIPDDESNVRNLVINEENGRAHVFCNSVWEDI